MSKYLNKFFAYINSSKRLFGVDGNFSYNVQVPQDRKFNRVCILDALIPKSYYLIDTPFNTFTLSEPGLPPVLITIPNGDYILSAWVNTLGAAVTGLLNANSPHHWNYVITNPYTLSSTQANTGKLTFTVSGNAGVQPSLIMGSELYEPFGFDPNTTNTFVGDKLTSTNVIKIQAEDRILITSNICVGSGGSDIGVLQAINSQGSPDFSTIVYYCPDIEAHAKVFASSGGTTFTFALTDENGRAIRMNGQNWNATLMMYYENDVYEKVKNFIKLMTLDHEHQQNMAEEEAKMADEEDFAPDIEAPEGASEESSAPQLHPETGQPIEESQGEEPSLEEQESGETHLADDDLPKDEEGNLVEAPNGASNLEIKNENNTQEQPQENGDLHLTQDDLPRDEEGNLEI